MLHDDTPEQKSNPLLAFIERLPAGVRPKLITLYRESLTRETGLIIEALGRDDLAVAGSLAHKLWGGAANLQDSNVAHVAKLIETAALDNRLVDAKGASISLQAACQASVMALARYGA
jgi:HPt (histidine-containing phosphotransfer) domain-containing protein